MTKTALCLVLCCAMPCAAQGVSSEARKYLAGALRETDGGKLSATLLALRSTKDKELAPLFAALARSGDKNRRYFAVEALAELAGPEAAPALLERLKTDSEAAIRHKALLHLLDLKAVSPAELAEAMQARDEWLQSFAARGLVQNGKGDRATDALRKLVQSQEQAVAGMARMGLLATGDATQLPELRRIFDDPKTPDAVLGLLLEQAAEAKISPALELAEKVAASGREGPLRVQAYEAIAAIAPDGAARLREAIEKTDQTVVQVYLLNLLVARPAGQSHLETVAARKDAVGLLARFELARRKPSADSAAAVAEALAAGHPVAVEYVLNRAKADVADRPDQALLYGPALVAFLRSFPPESSNMGPEHNRLAVAATVLADIGTPEGMNAIKEVLAGRYGAAVRAVAAGLRWSKNPAVCELAKPLLASPYLELAEDAALTLGAFGDFRAADSLNAILVRRQAHAPTLVTLAAWYLLKIDHATATAVQDLVKNVR